jgi:hypothetical protein
MESGLFPESSPGRVTDTPAGQNANRTAPADMTQANYQTPPTDTPDHAGRGAAQECAAIAADLERLKSMIVDAGDKLTASFNQVGALAPALGIDDGRRGALTGAIATAITALQFQDMAIQLTAHAQRRLGALQECLKSLSAEAALTLTTVHAQPVHQAEMSAGSIDLF